MFLILAEGFTHFSTVIDPDVKTEIQAEISNAGIRDRQSVLFGGFSLQ